MPCSGGYPTGLLCNARRQTSFPCPTAPSANAPTCRRRLHRLCEMKHKQPRRPCQAKHAEPMQQAMPAPLRKRSRESSAPASDATRPRTPSASASTALPPCLPKSSASATTGARTLRRWASFRRPAMPSARPSRSPQCASCLPRADPRVPLGVPAERIAARENDSHTARAMAVPDADEPSDEDLMVAYARGRADAFETLYARHRKAVYRYVIRHCRSGATADELFQDLWMNVIRGRSTYVPTARFATWLYTLAHHRLVDHWRASGLLRTVSTDGAD